MLRARSLSQLPEASARRDLSVGERQIFTQRTNAVVPLHWLSTAAAFSVIWCASSSVHSSKSAYINAPRKTFPSSLLAPRNRAPASMLRPRDSV